MPRNEVGPSASIIWHVSLDPEGGRVGESFLVIIWVGVGQGPTVLTEGVGCRAVKSFLINTLICPISVFSRCLDVTQYCWLGL